MQKSKLPSGKIRDIRGERFGRLIVESFSHIAPDKGKNAYWKCLCDCGKTHTVSSSALRGKSTVSCGCYGAEVARKCIKATHNKGLHLYFIRSGEYIKIGRADKPWLRLSQIRASNPFGAEIIHILENQGHREKELHEKFKHCLWTGEWFTNISDEEIVSIGDIKDG